MSWTVDRSRGLEWSGIDSVYNMNSPLRWFYLGIGFAGHILGLVGLDAAEEISVDQSLSAFIMVIIILPSLCAGAYGLTLFPKWFTDRWTLSGSYAQLRYNGEQSWSVSVDHIASVEVGRTSDWTPSRHSGYRNAPVSQYEWQVFLFLTDGSRRVIYSVNADRESAATLAASIKSWVDGRRASLAETSSVEPEMVREGFAI